MAVIKKFRITKIKNSKPLVSLKKISLSFQKNHLILDNINLDPVGHKYKYFKNMALMRNL